MRLEKLNEMIHLPKELVRLVDILLETVYLVTATPCQFQEFNADSQFA